MSRTLVLESAARSDIGRVRETNQDALVLRPELGLFVVADGMGGHASGELAASIAVESIAGFFEDPEITWPPDASGSPDDALALLVAAVKIANSNIQKAAAKDRGAREAARTTSPLSS